jgi:hypothetical protein
MHIQMQDEQPTVRVAAAPADAPGVVMKSQPTPTIEIKKPAAQPSAAPAMGVKPLVMEPASAPVAENKPASKSETSRIPLELATPAAAPAVNVKTIRVKPAGGTAALGVQVAAAQPAIPSKPIDDKRKTSRISLESALAMEDKGADKGAPKTIRLRKLGEATGKVTPTLDTIRAEPAGGGRAGMGQTARLEEEAETEEEGPTPTRRKTIKVKRPTDKPGFRVTAGGAAAAGAEGAAAGAEGGIAIPAKTTGFDWTSMVVAILTIIMTFVVMFMLASQAVGPNSSLTQLSSWTEGPDFGWTGKIPRAQ